MRPAEKRRAAFLARIAELERRCSELLSENLRLTRELAQSDSGPGAAAVVPNVDGSRPILLEAARAGRKQKGAPRVLG